MHITEWIRYNAHVGKDNVVFQCDILLAYHCSLHEGFLEANFSKVLLKMVGRKKEILNCRKCQTFIQLFYIDHVSTMHYLLQV